MKRNALCQDFRIGLFSCIVLIVVPKPDFKNIDIIRASKTYAKLSSDLTSQGILDRSYIYYFFLTLASFGGIIFSMYAIFIANGWLFLTLACLGFTFFSVQLGGLMHDSGHKAVFKSVKNNDILGYLCGGFLGMVYDNWKIRHNAHHAKPNQEDEDPDIEFPFLATSHELVKKKKGLERKLIKYQAFYYYPLQAIISFSNRLGASSYFFKKPFLVNWWKILLYAIGIIVLFPLPFILFSPAKALFVFLLIHITSGIYLANCFAPNHKGMPEVRRGMKLSFLEQQIMTSRNVQGGLVTDTLLLGLNYQVEHHLFPNCPRNKLKLITPYVKKVCKQLGLQYSSVNFVQTNKIIVSELQAVALTI